MRLFGVCLACVLAALVSALPAQDPPKRLEFTRMIAHWDAYGDRAAYLSFVDEAQPEVCQVGFYGGHFWSLAHTTHGAGYPAHFPKVGLTECGDWFQELNGELHKRNVKVVGHFNVKFLVGDPESPEGPRGFFKFYRDLWDEKQLGPKPVADPRDLLEKNADGTLISANNYSIGGMKEYWGCLNNPHWRAVMKAWVKAGVARGVDGYMINYFYRHNCLCEHCQSSFKGYLKERHTPAELQAKYAIADLAAHKFPEIVSWHDPKESTPLRREMLQFSQVANKQAFDDVFMTYGRSLKPDLIVGQWNHLGDFHQIGGDERCLLPADLWGKGEDYLWYSTGGSACFTDLAEGFLGDGTLRARYIRGTFDDKPFTLGKYEGTRIRAAIAELAANGGAPMGFYTRFTDPAARKVIAQYYGFMKRYDAAFHANSPHSETLLLYPRKALHNGDVDAVEKFRTLGTALLNKHVLFDVRPDDVVAEDELKRYARVYRSGDAADVPAGLSSFTAPQTVRVSSSRSEDGDKWHIHLVNYNRTEPKEKRSPGGGIQDEQPLAAPAVACKLRLPAGYTAGAVRTMTPEEPEPQAVAAVAKDGVVELTAPGFLVYRVVEIELKEAPQPQYELGDVRIPPASADEAKRTELSAALALEYLEQGAAAWSATRDCVSCHTNGTYMVTRPALSASFGKPSEEIHAFFVKELQWLQERERKSLQKAIRPAQVIYVAAGLAEWDAHVRGALSPATEQALALMFEIQTERGTWGTLDCWPPYESDSFHEATVAAMAAATAPGWLAKAAEDEKLRAGLERLQTYLRTETPPHDYGRVLLLWAGTRLPGLLTPERQQELVKIVAQHQRADGGWSIRTFAAPEAWGRGNRAERLRSEPDFATPASDGHMTGLAITVLRAAGVPSTDPGIQKGVAWLKSNQRVSGRWWTRSLNTDGRHFITYSGTAYPLLALQACDELR